MFSYSMRAFVLKILSFFRCQAYGHVAAVCRKEIPKCEKCAGGHETKECAVSLEKAVFVNSKGTHSVGDQKCLMREWQVEVDRIRVVQKVSYAEAVKRLPAWCRIKYGQVVVLMDVGLVGRAIFLLFSFPSLCHKM